MYSPKIDDRLIPKLYRMAKALKIPMTRLVSRIIENAIKNVEIESKRVEIKSYVVKDKQEYSIKGGPLKWHVKTLKEKTT